MSVCYSWADLTHQAHTVVLNFNRCFTHCDQLCLHSRAFIKPWVRKAHFYMHYNGCQSIMSVYFWAPSAIPCIYRICRQRLKLCLGFAAYFGLSPCNVLLGGKILHVILDQRSFFAALISSTCATTIENPLSSTHLTASYASTISMWDAGTGEVYLTRTLLPSARYLSSSLIGGWRLA